MIKSQVIELLLDHILTMIMNNTDDFVDFDVSQYTRIMSSEGEIVSEPPPDTQTQIFIYQQDYQHDLTQTNIDTVLNLAADCQWNGTDYDEWTDLGTTVTYSNPLDGDENFTDELNDTELPFITIS